MISQNREKEAIQRKEPHRNVLLRRADENEKAVILKMINRLKILSKNFAANKKEFMCASTIIIHFKLNSNTDFNLTPELTDHSAQGVPSLRIHLKLKR